MGEVFNRKLQDNVRGNIWETMRREAANMPALDKAQLGADIAGIFDPTPASDTVGAGLALARRDWWGAGASVLGYIPYVGDLAKIGKIGRIAPKTAEMLKMFMKGGDNLARAGAETLQKYFSRSQVITARRAAARRTRELMNRKRRDPNCRECQKVNPSNMPVNGGRWNTPDGKPPTSGSGTFTFDQPRVLPDGTELKSIEFRDGFPNFDPYVHSSGKHDLWQINGRAATDANALRAEHGVQHPGRGWTLHHFEDGQVGYVPTSLNNTIPHAGGNSIVNNDVYLGRDMLQIPHAIKSFWDGQETVPSSQSEIAAIENEVGAPLPAEIVEYLTTFGYKQFDMMGVSEVLARYDMSQQIVEKPVALSFLLPASDILEQFSVFGRPMELDPSIGPRIPPMTVPIGEAMADTSGLLLLQLGEKNRGSIWYWEHIDETWGTGENNLLGAVGASLTDMLKKARQVE